MIPGYVFQCGVESRDGSPPAFDVICEVIARWCSRFGVDLNVANFESNGEITSRLQTSDGDILFRWERADTAGVRALRLTTEQIDVSGQYLISTSITTVEDDESTTLQLIVGHDNAPGVVAGTYKPNIWRPRFFQLLKDDQRLQMHVFGKPLQEGYLGLQSPEDIEELKSELRQGACLPSVVIDGSSLSEQKVGELADKVQGIANVYVVDSGLRFLFEKGSRRLKDFEIGFLIWPSYDLNTLYLSTSRYESFVFAQILARTAGYLSRDTRWRFAAEKLLSEKQAKEEANRAELNEIRLSEKSKSKRIENLLQVKDDLERDLKAAIDARDKAERDWAQLVDEYDDYRILNVNHKELLRQANERNILLDPEKANRDSLVWSLPKLSASYQKFFEALTEASQESIFFTPAASRKWDVALNLGYPHIEKMQSELEGLGKAAYAFRMADGRTNGRVKEWLYENFGLQYAPGDDQLVSKKLHKFEWRGLELEKTKHIQVDQHGPYNTIGRIYFEIVVEQLCFVVDHVGLKPYE